MYRLSVQANLLLEGDNQLDIGSVGIFFRRCDRICLAVYERRHAGMSWALHLPFSLFSVGTCHPLVHARIQGLEC